MDFLQLIIFLGTSKTLAKVLKKGKIKNADEYYIIKEIICDLEYEFSNSDREILGKIPVDFETLHRENS